LQTCHLQEEAIMSENGPSDERLEAIYDRLDELDPNTFESRAAELLHGLGFSRVMMERKTKDMSGALCFGQLLSCKGFVRQLAGSLCIGLRAVSST
jgi:ATPase subunit of ABC transporter with duplicated ATPase domains